MLRKSSYLNNLKGILVHTLCILWCRVSNGRSGQRLTFKTHSRTQFYLPDINGANLPDSVYKQTSSCWLITQVWAFHVLSFFVNVQVMKQPFLACLRSRQRSWPQFQWSSRRPVMSIPVPDSYKNYMGTMGINTRSVIVATGIQGVKCSSVKGAAVRLKWVSRQRLGSTA